MFNIKVKPLESVLLRSLHKDDFSHSCEQSQPVCTYSLHHVTFPLRDRKDTGCWLDHISTSRSHTFSRRQAEFCSLLLCASLNVWADWLNEAAAWEPNLLRKTHSPPLRLLYGVTHAWLGKKPSLLSTKGMCIWSSVLQKQHGILFETAPPCRWAKDATWL